MPISAMITSAASLLCPKCGITRKSGKASCCGHGGSWFGNCGSVKNATFSHTWYEGISACKRQLQTAVGQQLYESERKANALSTDARMGMISHIFESIIIVVVTPISVSTSFALVNNISIAWCRFNMLCSNHYKAQHNDTWCIQCIDTTVKHPLSQPTITSLANGTILESMHDASPDMSAVAVSPNPANASFISREYHKLLYIITCVSMIIIVVCWNFTFAPRCTVKIIKCKYVPMGFQISIQVLDLFPEYFFFELIYTVDRSMCKFFGISEDRKAVRRKQQLFLMLCI